GRETRPQRTAQPLLPRARAVDEFLEARVVTQPLEVGVLCGFEAEGGGDRKSTRLNSSHVKTSYAVFCLKKKNIINLKNNEKKTTVVSQIGYAARSAFYKRLRLGSIDTRKSGLGRYRRGYIGCQRACYRS